MSNKQKTTNHITIPNKNIEIIKKHFSHYFDKNENFNIEKFKQELSKNEIDFSKESYGMDWLGKSYARLLASDEATTLLKEDEDWNKKNQDSQNLLIKGDNLEVLKHLSNAYYEKIKMIYIDPPYNTGSDGFVYQDDRKFTYQELSKLAGIDEEKAKRILEFTQSKSNSHSAWLTFMYPRLYIAKQLLKDDGVIFVSIDDNEVAQLRLLMDEIFGEDNFIGDIIWHSKYTTSNDAKYLSTQHENILFYGKNKEFFNIGLLDRSEKQDKSYKNRDNDPKGAWKPTPIHAKSGTEDNVYTIKFPNGIEWKAPDGRYPRYSKTRLLELFNQNELYFNSKGNVDKKTYLNEVKQGVTAGTVWSYQDVGHTHANNEELAFLIGKGKFDNPKGTKLIKRICKIANVQNSDLILDFFAGSGTTGDAVMQLNAEDSGNRKYILVQLPEKIDKKKNKTAYNFVTNELKIENPTIFEITKERLIRAGKKIQEDNKDKPASSKKVKCEGCNGEGEHCPACKGEYTIKLEATKKKDLLKIDFGFKIFQTTPIWEDYNLDAEEFDSQLKLFQEDKLKDEDLKILLTTWKTYDGIALTQNLKEINLDEYKGHYFDNKLYLLNKGFTTKNLKKLLEEIDKNPYFNPATIIAFGYNFESKVLREIAENIKNYANKKHIDVDFITRY
jgi:adenine-specific DNA-methyltransferase